MDVHSCNYSRILCDTPLFNPGKTTVDQEHFEPVVAYLNNELAGVRITGETTGVAGKDVFFGTGYLASRAKHQYPGYLALPLELKNDPLR